MLGATPDPRFHKGKAVKLSVATVAALALVLPAAAGAAPSVHKTPSPISGYR